MNKNTSKMDFEVYSERLATLHEYCFDRDHKPKKVEQKRFQVVNESMQMKSVKKPPVFRTKTFLLSRWYSFATFWKLLLEKN